MKKILLILLIVVLIAITGCKKFGFGTGEGSSSGNEEHVNSIGTDEKVEKSEKEEKKTIVTIKVEDTNIYVDDVECSDVDDMKDIISKSQSEDNTIKYEFTHDFAIKSTYDAVKIALYNLEDTLKIDVEYND